jgi:putative nucleotidyltransferase with HDIG domain
MEPDLRRSELIGGAAFLTAAGALALLGGAAGFSLGTAAVYVIAIAVASNVRFDVGPGFTVPTQAVFVPMLFALPPAVVPLLVVPGLVLGMIPDVLRGRIAPSWLLTTASNSWFALGPALVLVLAHDTDPNGQVGILVAALAAQFAFDFVAAAIRDRLFEDDPSLSALLREVAPIYAIDFALSLVGLIVAFAAASGYGQWPVALIAPLFVLLWVFSKERQERLEQLVELNDAYQGTALLLGDVVEADDSYTGAHSKSVVRLALEVADALGLDRDRRRNVEFGALLHDVGKLSIPKEIINKPGKLDEREWEIVKTHTVEGQKLLERIGGFMAEIGTIVRASHESWDGSGYPDGLAGEEIPIEARIVAACDSFNAMTTNRSYRKAMPVERAIAELERCAGSQFDPAVVAGLLEVVRAGGVEEGGAEPSAEREVATERRTAPAGPRPNRVLTTGVSPPPVNPHAEALAELAVTIGANVQPGQHVDVSAEVGHLETVRAIAAAAYARGAAFVDVQLSDPVVRWSQIDAGPSARLDHVPGWEADRVRELVARSGASILVAGPSFPGLFDGLDPRSVARASAGPSAQWREANRTLNWTIVPAATEGWARQLRPRLPGEEALSALWADLAHLCRLDEADPSAAWRERLSVLRERSDWLTSLDLRAVRLTGPGTELSVGLIPGGRWACAEMATPTGIAFVPNLPTEEVYTTPDPARVDGRVTLTRPAVIGGRRIEGVSLRFREGRVVGVDGPPEARALSEFLARDEGTARLGELALVDAESRAARLQQTFGETLLDENAASHIGLGYGFPELAPAASRHLANASDHHLDLMIGSPEVEVTGIDGGGSEHALLGGGHWAAPAGPPEAARSPTTA